MEECAVSDAVDAFAGWHPAVTEMVGATDVGARWALHDLAPLERWHTDRVVLMGDAAHAMVPHQGQGANQTIEDAIALADCLADAGDARAGAAALRRAPAQAHGPGAALVAPRGRPDAPPGRPGDRPPRRRCSRSCTPSWPGSIPTTPTPRTRRRSASPTRAPEKRRTAMPTATAAVLSANHEPFVLEEVEVEQPAARRGPRPDRGDRSLPHRPQRPRGAHPVPAPGRARTRGRGRRRGGRRRRDRPRARRPRRHVVRVLRRLPDLPHRPSRCTARAGPG